MLRHREIINKARAKISFWVALAEMEFSDDLFRLMVEDEVSRSELARRIGSSPAYITKALSGNTNFTLKTMVKLARAMDAVLHIRLAREGQIIEIRDPKAGIENGGSGGTGEE